MLVGNNMKKVDETRLIDLSHNVEMYLSDSYREWNILILTFFSPSEAGKYGHNVYTYSLFYSGIQFYGEMFTKNI